VGQHSRPHPRWAPQEGVGGGKGGKGSLSTESHKAPPPHQHHHRPLISLQRGGWKWAWIERGEAGRGGAGEHYKGGGARRGKIQKDGAGRGLVISPKFPRVKIILDNCMKTQKLDNKNINICDRCLCTTEVYLHTD